VKLLSFTSLFPNDVHPLHGLFVRERVAAMKELMDLRVVAPVPYFPAIPGLDTTPLSRYASYARVPKATTQGTLTIDYPRFITFPGLLKSYDGDFMYAGARRLVTKLFKSFRFQLIDAHWLFPDGYAAARLAADLRVPFAVTVRGDDISSFPQDPRKRPKLIATLAKADAVIGVCQALIDKAKELGAPPERCHVIPNGIDCETFRAVDRMEARQRLGLPESGRFLLSVGHLCERKGFHLLIEALQQLHLLGLTNLRLIIVGGPGAEGDFESELQRRARALPEGSVIFAGPRPHAELSDWYSAADLFCLASSREGWANVLMESLACGTPVVATNVWGTPEIISSDQVGLLTERSVPALTASIQAALQRQWSRQPLVAHVARRSWQRVARDVQDLYLQIHRQHSA